MIELNKRCKAAQEGMVPITLWVDPEPNDACGYRLCCDDAGSLDGHPRLTLDDVVRERIVIPKPPRQGPKITVGNTTVMMTEDEVRSWASFAGVSGEARSIIHKSCQNLVKQWGIEDTEARNV